MFSSTLTAKMNSTIAFPTIAYQNTTKVLTNWTFKDLERLNDAKWEVLLPARLVFALYMMVGITGNSLVIYVMRFRLTMNTQSMLIIYLAVFDLLNCLICVPADIFELNIYINYPSEVGCKIIRMIMTFINEASILTLVIVAVDRYRKICQPMKSQMSLRHTKRLLFLVIFVPLFVSWPSLIIFGFQTMSTGMPGISGYRCDMRSDSLEGTPYPTVYSSTLFLLFIAMCVCLIVLYSCILVAVRRHTRHMSKSYPNHSKHHTIRGIEYSKNNDSNSATTATEDTSVMRETSASDHRGTSRLSSSKDCHAAQNCTTFNDENASEGGKFKLKTYGERDNLKVAMDGMNCEKTINMKIGTCQNKTEIDVVALPAIDIMHASGDSLNQKLESENIGLEYTRQTGISHLTPSNPSDITCISNIPSHEKNSCMEQFNKSSVSKSTESHCKSKSSTAIVNASDDERKNEASLKKKKKTSGMISKLDHKMTVIAFSVTAVFILSYMPYLSLQISKPFVKGHFQDLEGASLISYTIFLRSYYINSMANPIIYGLLNNLFRRQVLDLLSKLFKCCKISHTRK